MDRDEFEFDVLALGMDDEEVCLTEVVSLAIRKFAVDQPLDVVRERSLAVVRRLVEDGLVRVAMPRPADGSFVDRTEEFARLEAEVREAYDETRMGLWRDRFWLLNTAAGDAVVSDVPDGYSPYAEDRRLETLSAVQRGALVRGVSGPVGLRELAEMFRADGASGGAAREEAVATARRFVELGLVTPGVRVGDRFVERPGELEQLLADPGPDHVWLRNRRTANEAAAEFR